MHKTAFDSRKLVLELAQFKPNNYKFSFNFSKPPITRADASKCNTLEIVNEGLSILDKCALVILAGGHGTRLGFDKPKLLLPISDNVTLFQFILKKIMQRRLQAQLSPDIKTNIFILTSEYTKGYINEYIKHNLTDKTSDIDLTSLSIEILVQDEVQCHGMSFNTLNVTSPNGNGGLFEAIEKCQRFWQVEIDYLHVISSDNILSEPLDVMALGFVKLQQTPVDVLLKCIETNSCNMGIVAVKVDQNGSHPYVVEYSEMVDDVAKQNVKLGNTCDHIFSVQFVKDFIGKQLHKKMPWHLVKRTENTEDGGKIPVYKLEKFIFDSIQSASNVIAYVMDTADFAPIKCAADLDPNNPNSAINKYRLKFNEVK